MKMMEFMMILVIKITNIIFIVFAILVFVISFHATRLVRPQTDWRQCQYIHWLKQGVLGFTSGLKLTDGNAIHPLAWNKEF